MTREDGITSDLSGMAAMLLSEWLARDQGRLGLAATEAEITQALTIAKSLYVAARQVVRQLQAEAVYAPLTSAAEIKP